MDFKNGVLVDMVSNLSSEKLKVEYLHTIPLLFQRVIQVRYFMLALIKFGS
jgi:hypothetical protein